VGNTGKHGGAMSPDISLSCGTLQSLKGPMCMTPRAGKGPISTLAAGCSDTFDRLDFKNHTQPALESRHETRAAARLGAQTAAGPLR
jgi:hypothetical protein